MDKNRLIKLIDSSINDTTKILIDYYDKNINNFNNLSCGEIIFSNFKKERNFDKDKAILYIVIRTYLIFIGSVAIASQGENVSINNINKVFINTIKYLINFLSDIGIKANFDNCENIDNDFQLYVAHYLLNQQAITENNLCANLLKSMMSYCLSSKDNMITQKISNDLNHFVQLAIMYDDEITEKEDSIASQFLKLNESLNINLYTHSSELINENDKTSQNKSKSLTNTKKEINDLIGLSSIKKEIDLLESYILIQKERKKNNLHNADISLHFVFSGNPGTGKTTVARLLGDLFYNIGVLEKGHVVEVSRADLVAAYIGQTAIKTEQKLKEALGGILFIDEAYTLARNESGWDYFGQEAIDTIVKFMEDHRDDLIIIIAGYPKLIDIFVSSNPGLKSRFTKYLNFLDYTEVELCQILHKFLNKFEYTINNSTLLFIQSYLKYSCDKKDNNFGNARFARQFFENSIKSQSYRIFKNKKEKNKFDLTTLILEDFVFEENKNYYEKIYVNNGCVENFCMDCNLKNNCNNFKN